MCTLLKITRHTKRLDISKNMRNTDNRNIQIMKSPEIGFKIIMLNMLKKKKQNLLRKRNGNYKKS